METTVRLAPVFGEMSFGQEAMRSRLSKAAYREFVEVIERNGTLSRDLADQVAHAMKEWAMAHGATHFTHWFQPMRGVTAEKHDAFLSVENGVVLERFSGAQLIQSEPDASSFPSGGMRSTFEARGYTAWDPTSPAFLIRGKKTATLVIPSVYLSYTGEVLDLKTPLLRSLGVVERIAFKVLKKFGNRTARYVRVTVGPEQEYFLIDKKLFARRPDLLLTGRTLQGTPSAKHQQFEDHYFGAIKPKVLAFMEDVDARLFERGIPYKTRHNEVAPNQFELAPSYTEANLAIDYNLQTMEILRQVADEHGFALLLHEKPFHGINGSGKHLNWSLQDSDGNNLLEPGEAPKRNVQFLVFLSAVLLGVNRYGGLLRAAVADAGNDHRLGANEAPPSVMSVFIGGYLRDVIESIAKGQDVADWEKASLDLKVRHLPGVVPDTTDRNRTSPVAFTGNKFEFRAVGSSQNVSEATVVLNLAVACGLEDMLARIEKQQAALQNEDVAAAALAAVRNVVEETRRIRFEGNNYTDDWLKEAETRGLPNARNTPQALCTYLEPDVIQLYQDYEVLTEAEIHSRVEIKRETYVRTKVLELNVLREIGKTQIKPALLKQISLVATALDNVPNDSKAHPLLRQDLDRLAELLERLKICLKAAGAVLAEVDKLPDVAAQASYLGDTGCRALEELRAVCDAIEIEVAAELWPLPKYTDMLHLI